MKRMSREERIGAITLGVVALAVIGGGMWWRRASVSSQDMSAEVKIVSVADSSQGAEADADADKDSSYTKKSRGKRKSRKHRSEVKGGGGRKKQENIGAEAAGQARWRDPLTDTIPVSDPHQDPYRAVNHKK